MIQYTPAVTFQKYYCLSCLPPVMAFIKIELEMVSFCNKIPHIFLEAPTNVWNTTRTTNS